MKVSSSSYLAAKRPVIKELVRVLREDYRYVSVLAADSRAYSYRVSGTGVSASQSPMFSDRGFVLRVFDETGYAEYSFNRLSETDIPAIREKVAKELVPLNSLLPETLTRLRRNCVQEEDCTMAASTEYEIHPKDMGDDEILNRLTGLREGGLRENGKLIDFMASLSYQEIHKLFISEKKDMEQNIMWTAGSLVAIASRGQELKTAHRGFSTLGGIEILDKAEKMIPDIVKTVMELLESEPIVPGEYECVCTPSVTGMIVHEAFGHGVEMDMFVKDRALAKNFIGEYVASPLVNMHDASCNAENAGTYFFDDEGTPAHDTLIIDKGILKQGISDLLSADYLGTEPTGNGKRESSERKAYTRMTNTYFEGGTDSVEDMIASVKYGFLLDEPSSGMEDPKNWGIQCMVSYAREIRDGKLTGKIFSPIVLTGYVPDLLKSISMMSPEVELEGGGMCGKGYKEWVKVSDGGPYIKARIRLG